MNIVELYQKTPVEKLSEILAFGDRLYFDCEEYVILADGELKLVHSHKGIEQGLAQIRTKLGIK